MRKGFLIVVSVLIALVACRLKDEKTRAVKAEIGGFERDWAATNEILNNWGLNMQQELANDSTLQDHCKQLKETYETEMNNWNVAGKAFEDWKAKFDKGEIETAKATQTLKDFKLTLEKYNTALQEWELILEDCTQPVYDLDTIN